MITYRTARIGADDHRFAAAYEMLDAEFGSRELESAPVMAARLSGDGLRDDEPTSILLARYVVDGGAPDWRRPVGVVAGDYLPLPGRLAAGALGNLVTDRRHRSAGHGAALTAGFERAIAAEAITRGDSMGSCCWKAGGRCSVTSCRVFRHQTGAGSPTPPRTATHRSAAA